MALPASGYSPQTVTVTVTATDPVSENNDSYSVSIGAQSPTAPAVAAAVQNAIVAALKAAYPTWDTVASAYCNGSVQLNLT